MVLRSLADENGYLLPGGGKSTGEKISGHDFDLELLVPDFSLTMKEPDGT